MAEYIGRGELGVARAVFFSTFRFQTAVAFGITSIAVVIVYFAGDPQYRTASLFQVASILPAMAVFVPSQANAARENLRANVTASIVGNVVYVIAVALSLAAGWDLIGIAVGIFLWRTVEFVFRSVPIVTWAKSLPVGLVPQELRRRMFMFSGQSMVLMLLNVIVWDRSDIIFLKWLSRDISQVTFFSVAFNLSEKALLLPQTFGTAVGASIMAQYGRDKAKLSFMVSGAARYMLMVSGPLLIGLACLSGPVITILYGRQYLPAIPVLGLAAVLALPKTLMLPGQNLLEANEDQKFMVACSVFCGLVNVALDLLLIPHHQALGAAVGNGTAQTLAVLGIWSRTVWKFELKLDWKGLSKIAVCVLVMAVTLLGLRAITSPLLALIAGPVVGAATFLLMMRVLSVIDEQDIRRVMPLLAFAPGPLKKLLLQGLKWIAPNAR